MSVLLLNAEYHSKGCIVTVYLLPLVKDTSLPPAPHHKNTTINHGVFCENFHGIYVPGGGIVGWWTSGFWILLNAAWKLSREVVPAYTSQHHQGPTSPPFKLWPEFGFPLIWSFSSHTCWPFDLPSCTLPNRGHCFLFISSWNGGCYWFVVNFIYSRAWIVNLDF